MPLHSSFLLIHKFIMHVNIVSPVTNWEIEEFIHVQFHVFMAKPHFTLEPPLINMTNREIQSLRV